MRFNSLPGWIFFANHPDIFKALRDSRVLQEGPLLKPDAVSRPCALEWVTSSRSADTHGAYFCGTPYVAGSKLRALKVPLVGTCVLAICNISYWSPVLYLKQPDGVTIALYPSQIVYLVILIDYGRS